MNPIIINSSVDLDKARSLLHSCYLEHLEWEITHGNPSGIKVQKNSNQTIITDDYDDLSTWFSVLEEQKPIACGRLCYEDSDGLLEIERYSNARKSLKNLLIKKTDLNIVELNREAILPKYINNKKLYFLLLESIFKYCLEKHQAIITTTHFENWIEIYGDIGFPRLDGLEFKYHDSEPSPVLVYFSDSQHIRVLLKRINILLREV